MGSGLAAQSAFGQTAGERIPTAMIGTGNRGSYVLKGVLEQPNAKVAALCDLKPARLDTAASAAAKDNPTTYTDWRKIIDRKDIGAVFIATPPHLHAEMAVAALQAGKHVYCEKPIGITPEQVRDIVKAAKAANRVFVSGQQLRSVRYLSQTVEKIRGGAIGDVLMVKAQRHGSADIPHDSSSSDWYFDVSKSGGYLIEMSVHNLDACNWAIGKPPGTRGRVRWHSTLQERSSRKDHLRLRDSHLRLREWREDGIHTECVSSSSAAHGWPIHSRFRFQRRCRSDADEYHVPAGNDRRADSTCAERGGISACARDGVL